MINNLFKKEAFFIPHDTAFYDRRVVLIGSREKILELGEQIDWKATSLRSLIPGGLGLNFIENLQKGKLSGVVNKKRPPTLELAMARKKFKFPHQHPIDGVMYGCCDFEPDLYLPLAGFHDHFYETKMNAFVELCSSLNAKEIQIMYAEENGEDITSKFKGTNIPTPKGMADVGGDVSYHSKTSDDTSIFYSFGQPTKPLREFKSSWMNSEPSWKTLQKVRIEGDAEKFTANFNHIDEMGITADLAAGLNKMGINIGGTYSKLTKRRFKFQVEFWPKDGK